jgi:glucose 1-dehydrogenase
MLVAYAATKAGLWAVTQSMAKELAELRILVNAVTPGATITAERIAALQDGTFVSSQVPSEAVKTREMIQNRVDSGAFAQMMPLGRPDYPDDIAKVVLFLASEMASYISEACLTVDGAQSLR